MPKKQSPAVGEPVYRTGAAARLSGIPVETLRVWERRYHVVGPQTSASGQRHYRPEEVARLGVIKQLVDAGHAIGSIAALDTVQLRRLLDKASGGLPSAADPGDVPSRIAGTHPRVAIVGEALALRAERHRPRALQVVASSADRQRAATAFQGIAADTLLIELPTLQRDTAETIRALASQVGASRVVVEYGYGPRRIEQEMAGRGWLLVRAPMDMDRLAALCGAPAAAPRGGAFAASPALAPAAPPRFDARALAEISMASVSLHCECPRHVTDLLVRLGNFETYSAECENRDAADAALHRYLKEVTGSARALLETALTRIAEAEGIALPPARSRELSGGPAPR